MHLISRGPPLAGAYYILAPQVNNTTMSDLAPFVAAAIRDKVVMEQQEEIEILRAERDEARRIALITVTNADGTKVYAETPLAKQTVESDGVGGITHFAIFYNETGLRGNPKLAACGVREIETAVIRVGGVKICSISDFNERGSVWEDGPDDEGYVRFGYGFTLEQSRAVRRNLGRFMSIDVEYGPVPEEYHAAGIEQDPNMHENAEIESVRFMNIEFNTTHTPLFE